MPGVLKATITAAEMVAVKHFAAYPVPNFHAERITQGFGQNYLDLYKRLGMIGHNGIDIRCATGTNLYAVFDGTVDATSFDPVGGNAMAYVTDGLTVPGHAGSYRLRIVHFHLLSTAFGKGAKIKAGQFICRSDNTGSGTTGPHLHFGLKIEKKAADGMWYTIDHDNGFFGAVDPEPYWPDLTWQFVPADIRYGKEQNQYAEMLWSSVQGTQFFLRFRRPATVRERNAGVYGGWSNDEIALTSVDWRERPKT